MTEKSDAPPLGDENWAIPIPATGDPLYALIPWAFYQRLIARSEAHARDHALEQDVVRIEWPSPKWPSPKWMQAPTQANDDSGVFDAGGPWATEPELDHFKGAISQEQMPLEALDRLLEGDHPVKVFRKHRGLTQKELATMIGLNPTYLSQIETRKRGGSMRVYRRLATALAVDIGDLID